MRILQTSLITSGKSKAIEEAAEKVASKVTQRGGVLMVTVERGKPRFWALKGKHPLSSTAIVYDPEINP